MAQESSVGLKKIEIADVPATGLPTTWTELKAAAIGTAILTEEANTSEAVKVEQQPTGTYRKLTTEYGETTYTVSLYDVTTANLNKLKKGTIVPATSTRGKTWKKSREAVELIQAVKLTTFDDYEIILPKSLVEALINWPMTIGELGKVDLTFTALLPDDSELAEVEVSDPLEEED